VAVVMIHAQNVPKKNTGNVRDVKKLQNINTWTPVTIVMLNYAQIVAKTVLVVNHVFVEDVKPGLEVENIQ